ncbi:MAG: carboxypeptidase-like regulatory domain-containing protein [Acidobacteriota bacterium]
MSILEFRRRTTFRYFVGVALLLAMLSPAPSMAAVGGTSKVSGSLRDPAGKPVAGATVVLRLMESEGIQVKGTTGAGGDYSLEKLPYGHYLVAFEFGGQSYAANRILTLPPRQKLKANFEVSPFLPEDLGLGLKEGANLPGTSVPVAGVARLEEKTGPSGIAWFSTGKGVAVLVAGGAAIVAGLIALSSGDSSNYSTGPRQ